MRKIYVQQGYPGSGKTTLSNQWLSRDPEHRSRVSRDDLRQQLFNAEGILTPEQESVVTKVLNAQIVALLKADKDIMIDATNLNAKFLRQLSDFCKKNGATSFTTVKVDTPVDNCVLRDRKRFESGGRGVGEAAIRGIAKRFPIKNWPTINWEAGEDIATKQYTGTPRKPKGWIVDIDGTLAKMVDRGPYDTSRYHTDELVKVVADLVCHLFEHGDKILITSGRSEDFREVTEKWLQNNNVRFDQLIMRKSGDVRNDAIVKEELFWEHIAPHYDIQACFDDRDRVVEKWRSMGLVCLQVAPGAF